MSPLARLDQRVADAINAWSDRIERVTARMRARAMAARARPVVAYYAEGDVLYVSFEHVAADRTESNDERGVIRRYREGRLVGVTFVDFAHVLRGDAHHAPVAGEYIPSGCPVFVRDGVAMRSPFDERKRKPR